MLYKYPKNRWSVITKLFADYVCFETIIKGTLKQRLGEIFVDDLDQPKNAVLRYRSLLAFVGAGEGENLDEFCNDVPEGTILLCPNENWLEMVKERYEDKLTIVDRIKFSSKNLDIEHIKRLKANPPEGYQIVKLTDEIIDSFDEEYKHRYTFYDDDCDKLKEIGFGFCAFYDGKMVSLAATFLPFYKNAFEIQINTHPAHQGKGLATLVCAYLIEYSLENGFEPRWDALTPISVGLAKKLGYTNPIKYQMLILEEK